ncbi:plastocyanin/azurin family copper-binding protein [Thauera sp.]|uniref:plastocyanin/azurin family copper-binding protein n=1 Tax=Thauera sp. TaxID=1905334 RepID=UPI0039E631E5
MAALACIAATTLAPQAWGADHVVEMLDIDDAGATMAFKPMYLTVQPGDTVTFKPTHKTHFVKLMTAPAGVKKFTSKEDEEYSVTFDKAGVYFYVCPPHMMMAMIGAIQVGEGEEMQSQIPAAVKSVQGLRGRMMTNANRADELIGLMEAAK